jgi:hypothetical protein
LQYIYNATVPVKIIYGKYYDGEKRSDGNYKRYLCCVKKWNHNVYFKLYNLCKLENPFIYIDSDAFLLEDLNLAIESSRDQPLICVNHQTVQGHTAHINFKFLNSGFMIVSKPSFLDFQKIYNMRYIYIYICMSRNGSNDVV